MVGAMISSRATISNLIIISNRKDTRAIKVSLERIQIIKPRSPGNKINNSQRTALARAPLKLLTIIRVDNNILSSRDKTWKTSPMDQMNMQNSKMRVPTNRNLLLIKIIRL